MIKCIEEDDKMSRRWLNERKMIKWVEDDKMSRWEEEDKMRKDDKMRRKWSNAIYIIIQYIIIQLL